MKKQVQSLVALPRVRGFFALALLSASTLMTPVVYGQEEGDAAPAPEDTAAAPAAPDEATPPPEPTAKTETEAKPAPNEEMAKPQAAIKPWQLNVDPIFKGPTVKRFMTPSDLTGRDRQILENLDYKPAGTKLRLEQIRKLTAELRKAPPRSEAALNASLSILRLYEEQGMVFEWMRVVGIVDPKYPDLNQTLKNIRRQQAQRYQELLLNHPKNPNVKQWRFKLTIARLKLGDPSVRDEAAAMLKTLQGVEQHELAAVGLTLDAIANRLPSPFGTIEQVMQTSTDQYEGAALKLMLAEQEVAKNKVPAAIALLQDVIATCKNIRRADKEQTPGNILQAAAALLVDLGLRNTAAINQEIYQTLLNNDLADYARAYLEEFALKTYSKNLPLALKAYGDALAMGQANDALKQRVETRMLDLTIASNDPKMILIAWERVISRGIQKSVSLDSQMLQSMNIVMTQFKLKPERDLATKLVGMHDSFVRGFPAYAAREEYELRMIDILNQTKQYTEVGRRSEIAANKFKDKMNRISALQYNLRARTQLMGLGMDLKIAPGQKLTGEPVLATGYIANADKLRALLPKPEGDQLLFSAAFVQLLLGNKQVYLARFEDAFTRAPRHPAAAESASVLLETMMQRKEYSDLEKLARSLVKLGVIPSREPFRNLPKIIEQVVFEHAKQLFDAQQYDAAGNRYASFQREFQNSANAPAALERAGAAFGLAKKNDLSMMAYELYLKLYPRLPQAKDIRWAAAELARAAKLNQKAADHYRMFGQLYPQDAAARKVYLKAAEAFRDANKIPDALGEYERHLKTQTAPADQKKTLESIAELAQKGGNAVVALSAFERLVKLVKVPDEVINVNFNLMMVYQKLGREEQAKKAANTVMTLRPSTADGFKLQSKARFTSGRFEINSLRTRQVMNQKDLKQAIQTLVKDYERVKGNLLAPCEIPGVDWCVLGNYEVSKLSGDLAKLLALVEPQSHLDENLVNELKAMILFNKDKFKSESRSFALQAEDAMTHTAPLDQETSERIKLYVQQVKQARETDDTASGEAAGGSSGDAASESGGEF